MSSKTIKKTVKPKNTIACAQQIMNFSSIQSTDRFDKKTFDSEAFIEKLSASSPKLLALLNNIQKLDKKDFNSTGKLYKHYIYSGVIKGYGAKIIASALIAAGYQPVFSKQNSNIKLSNELLSIKNESKFAVLSSTALYNTPVTQNSAKEIINTFNKRPQNVYGNLFRIIILDSGFKEGVDLFDVKYCHIFEDQLNPSDLVQAQGRALRFRGQCGLPFNKGWVLNVFNYSLVSVKPRFYFLKNKKSILKQLQGLDSNLSFRLNLQTNMTDLIQKSAVDYNLNKNVNDYNETNYTKYLLPLSVSVLGLSLLSLFAFKK